MAKRSGNPKNRASGRVTVPSAVPKHIRQAVTAYKAQGGTLAELQAIDMALAERLRDNA